jgi:UDP-glucose 4-epimerase
MRVVVTGAGGNAGRSVIEALAEREEIGEIVGLVRQAPPWGAEKASWAEASVVDSPLEPLFDGADAVIHLDWAVQPSHDRQQLELINVGGSQRVFDAAATAAVPKLIYGSSVGAY